MLVGEGGDLGQMGYAKHLLRPGEGFQLLADGFRRPAADPNVDFVKDQRARDRRLSPLSPPSMIRALLDAYLEREHHARHLASRRNLMQRLHGLARIGRDAALDRVPPVLPPLRSRLREG